jgi:hypothetical protein
MTPCPHPLGFFRDAGIPMRPVRAGLFLRERLTLQIAAGDLGVARNASI